MAQSRLRLKTKIQPDIPPHGSIDLFYDAAEGVVKVIDHEGAAVSFSGAVGGDVPEHTHTSDAISDRTYDGAANPGKVLATRSSGPLGEIGNLKVSSLDVGSSLRISNFGQLLYGSPAKTYTMPQADAGSILATRVAVTASSPTTGFSLTGVNYHDQFFYWTPAGTLATGTLNLPTIGSYSRAGQVIRVWSTQIVTSFTVAAGGGTILGPTLSTVAANTPYAFQCTSIDGAGTWVRIQ